MSSDKGGKEKKLVGTAAGLAVAAGFVWGVFRFIKGRREEDALIREYYGDREDFRVPSDSEQNLGEKDEGEDEHEHGDDHPQEVLSRDDDDDNHEVVSHGHGDDADNEVDTPVGKLKTEVEEGVKAVEDGAVPEVEQKPWFLSLFSPPKPKESTPASKEEKEKEKEKGKCDDREGEADNEKNRQPFRVKELKKVESYEIKKGDTLWGISRRYRIPLDKLKAANGLDTDHIYAGENLVIPED